MIHNPQSGGTHLPALTNPAGAAQILSGYQAINADGEIVTGTIPSQGAQTITPGTSAKAIAAGRYLSGTQTIAGDADLVAGNIKSGVNLFGVNGTARVVTERKQTLISVLTFTISNINNKHFYILAGQLGNTDTMSNMITDGLTLALFGDSVNNIYEIVVESSGLTGGTVRAYCRPFTGTATASDGGIQFNLTYEMQGEPTIIYY